jgi:hypothetical protein
MFPSICNCRGDATGHHEICTYASPSSDSLVSLSDIPYDFKAAYLFEWLLLLRIEEVIHLEFESIDVIPGERKEIFFFNFVTC